MRIPRHIVDKIYSSADIVEVVGDYVQLKKRGQNFWGLSPFKAERTPSFSVSPVKQIYKDFASGKGGNVISFLMELEGYTYVEALQHLARKYNIELEMEDGPSAEQTDRRASLLALNKWAAQWFAEQLNTEEGQMAGLSYFRERGFPPKTLEEFQLGYSPDAWTALTEAAMKHQFTLETLLETGLTLENEDRSRRYDRFRGRVIFPLHDVTGRVVGFAGRILRSDAKAAKYVNSPESIVYNKSALLYGLYFGRQAIREAGECLLVEGYTDVISLHQAGVRNAVASSGTSLTEQQVQLISRYAKNVLIVYDGDTAGVNAASRAVDLLLAGGLTPRVLWLPDNHDPDSYVRKFGPSQFQAYAKEQGMDFVAFRIRVFNGGAAGLPSDPARHTALVSAVAETIARIPDELARSLYCRHAASQLAVDEQILISTVNKAAREQYKAQRPPRERNPNTAQQPNDGQPTFNPDLPLLPFGDDTEGVVIIGEDMPPLHGEPVSGNGNAAVREPEVAGTVDSYHQERELVRLMLNHPEGTVSPPEAAGPVHLYDYLMTEIGDVPFAHPPFEALRRRLETLREAQEAIRPAQLLHELPEIEAQLVAELLSFPYELSENWIAREIVVPPMDANLLEAAEGAVLHFMHKKMRDLIRQNQQELASATDDADLFRIISRKKRLDKKRVELAAKLGIVITL